jgi:hypothetical protein
MPTVIERANEAADSILIEPFIDSTRIMPTQFDRLARAWAKRDRQAVASSESLRLVSEVSVAARNFETDPKRNCRRAGSLSSVQQRDARSNC